MNPGYLFIIARRPALLDVPVVEVVLRFSLQFAQRLCVNTLVPVVKFLVQFTTFLGHLLVSLLIRIVQTLTELLVEFGNLLLYLLVTLPAADEHHILSIGHLMRPLH